MHEAPATARQPSPPRAGFVLSSISAGRSQTSAGKSLSPPPPGRQRAPDLCATAGLEAATVSSSRVPLASPGPLALTGQFTASGQSTGVTGTHCGQTRAQFRRGRFPLRSDCRRVSRPTGRPLPVARCGTPGPKEDSPLLALTLSLSLLHSQRRQLRVALALAPRLGAAQPAARAASVSGRCSPAGHR